MRTGFLLISLIIFSAPKGFSQSGGYDPTHRYSVDELQTDFRFLRTKLETIHPNLYLYTAKANLNFFFDSLYKSIANPLTGLEFYNVITPLYSKIKDGHTMFLPGEESTNFFNENGKFFPFYISIINNKLYVALNCSTDPSIEAGTEILSINGISAAGVTGRLLMRQVRDGDNQAYPVWILNNYFKEYFGFSFGHPLSFSIGFKKNSDKSQIKTVYALSKDSIRLIKQARYPNKVSSVNDKQGITLEINQKRGYAVLTIKSFDYEILKSVYKQDFDSTIKNVFLRIRNMNITNLVLDIRNNQGGDFEPGSLLLSYLLRHPVKYLENSEEYKMIKPVKNSYKGNLYILINGGSFSITGIISSYLDLVKRAVFAGEETGGNRDVISGNPTEFVLPNTKILCEISATKYVIRRNYRSGHGVIPAYSIDPAINDIINNQDKVKQFILHLISKSKS